MKIAVPNKPELWHWPLWPCLAIALTGAPALASGTVDASRVEERIPTQVRPENAPSTSTGDRSGREADNTAAAGIQPFALREITFIGASVLGPAALAELTAPWRGKMVDGKGLESMAQAITEAYRSRGYFLSRAIIPPQDASGGNLIVKVLEGHIDSVEVTGISQADARSQFARTLGEKPLRRPTFERELLLLSDRFGYSVNASQILSDPADPARFLLKLDVATAPVSLRFFADNRGTEANGPDQAFASMSFNGLFTGTDRLTTSVFVSPSNTNELFFGEISWATSWWGGNFASEFGTSVTATEDGTAADFERYYSETMRSYARFTVPIIRSRAASLWAGLTVESRDSEKLQPAEPARAESLRVLRGSLSFTETGGGVRQDIMLDVARGLDGFGASRNRDTGLTNDDSRPQFSRVRLTLSRVQPLWGPFDMVVSAAGQYGDGSLPGSEEFSVGGNRFGRAYDYGEITGDHGVAGLLELRYSMGAGFIGMKRLQAYVFGDAARVWNAGFDPAGPAEANLTSAGGGIRLNIVPGVTLSAEAAQPIGRVVATQGDRNTRFFFSLSLAW